MSKHRAEIEIEIDDQALAEHLAAANGEPPYSADLNEWNFDDVCRAVELDIVDSGDARFAYIGKVG